MRVEPTLTRYRRTGTVLMVSDAEEEAVGVREEWEARHAIAAVDEVLIVSWGLLARLSEASYIRPTADYLFEGRDLYRDLLFSA